jgi:hypothetical protein
MTYNASPAPVGLACDTSSFFTPAQAAKLWAASFRAIGLYVPLPTLPPAAGDINAAKLAYLTEMGFAVWLWQHVRYPGWKPAAHSGSVDALVACGAARGAGYPIGAHIFLDLEGIAPETTADELKTFSEQWASTVLMSGYLAGVYCGYDDPLGPDGLYGLHGVNSYSSDAGHRKVSTRGIAIQQGPQIVVGGVTIDTDQIQRDLLGELPVMATAATSAPSMVAA